MTQSFEDLAREIHGKPRWAGSALIGAILLFLLLLFTWAALTEIDDVTRAQGKIVPSGELQIVQASETGVITQIMVQEGVGVRQGDPLIALDPTDVRAKYEEELGRLNALKARAARLEAEISRGKLVFPPDLIRDVPKITQSEHALYKTRLNELEANKKVLNARKRIHEEELLRSTSELEIARESKALLEEEMALVAPLVKRKLEPELALITLKRKLAENAGQVNRAQTGIEIAKSSIKEVADQLTTVDTEYLSESLQLAAQNESDIAALEARLPALVARIERALITSPVDGTVNLVHLKTMGGVVQQSQKLVEIVPNDGDVMVEAHVQPKDIGFLRPNQEVRVRLTAYDSSRYGSLEGEITRIGADAIPSDDGQSTVFAVTVKLTGQLTDAAEQELAIIPGMAAEVDILSEPKTVLDYLIKPVVRIKEQAFRD